MSQIGSQKRTTDGVIGNSATPIRLYAIIVASGATAAAPALYDGTTTGGTLMDTFTCPTVSVTNLRAYPGGLLFPNGLYIDVDGNTTYVTCIYEQAG